ADHHAQAAARVEASQPPSPEPPPEAPPEAREASTDAIEAEANGHSPGRAAPVRDDTAGAEAPPLLARRWIQPASSGAALGARGDLHRSIAREQPASRLTFGPELPRDAVAPRLRCVRREAAQARLQPDHARTQAPAPPPLRNRPSARQRRDAR